MKKIVFAYCVLALIQGHKIRAMSFLFSNKTEEIEYLNKIINIVFVETAASVEKRYKDDNTRGLAIEDSSMGTTDFIISAQHSIIISSYEGSPIKRFIHAYQIKHKKTMELYTYKQAIAYIDKKHAPYFTGSFSKKL